ncbi:MAG: hypothetical protein RJB66_2405 [Pseudomonadota bacterium]|jgi:hypothetical protein
MFENKSETLLFDLWTKQLHKEYDQINWSYRLKLKKPQIIVLSAQSYYGQWDPLLRQIKISKQLIEKASWRVVIEVLKHEIAHQLVTDELGIEEGHGPNFIRFCERLGIHKSLQKSKASLDFSRLPIGSVPEVDERESSSEAYKLIQRAERLLSLAQSNNEHEALVAMEKVNELYEKYNVERLKNKVPNAEYTFLVIPLGSQKIHSIYSVICSLLSEHFFVEPILSQTFCQRSCLSVRTIELFGTFANVKMAEYVFHFLKNKVQELWLHESKKSRLPVGLKRSYQLGLLNGFNEKLSLSRRQRYSTRDSADNNKSLVSVDDPALGLFIRDRHPRLVSKRANTRSLDRAAYSQGQKEGIRIILNKGIDKREKLSKLLLK